MASSWQFNSLHVLQALSQAFSVLYRVYRFLQAPALRSASARVWSRFYLRLPILLEV